MVLFDIPDIRLFHSKDERFSKQFEKNKITKFTPFSKYPACYKDISFWIDNEFSETEVASVVRETAGDLIESFKLIDSYTNSKTGKKSLCYRLAYRSFSRNLQNDEVDVIQEKVIAKLKEIKGISLRT